MQFSEFLGEKYRKCLSNRTMKHDLPWNINGCTFKSENGNMKE